MALLQLEDITMRFGGLTAVANLNESIDEHALLGLIGPNGAGKTTVFNVITGVYTPTEGRLTLNNQSIAGLRPSQIASAGVARTFQNIRLFHSLSVSDNIRAGFNRSAHTRFFGSIVQSSSYYAEERNFDRKSDELLDMFGLLAARDELARNLSYGDQRRVEIVRAIATSPQLLLLDEPAAGMNATEKSELMSLIRYIRTQFELAIMLIEHDMQVVMGVCERITVLDYGVKIASGTPDEVKRNPRVVEAYLGETST